VLWQDTGLEIHQGEGCRVTTQGTWKIGGFFGKSTAVGIDSHLLCFEATPLPLSGEKIGALVGKIGVHGNILLVADTKVFIADSKGILFLRMNDPDIYMWDNSGQLNISIKQRRLSR